MAKKSQFAGIFYGIAIYAKSVAYFKSKLVIDTCMSVFRILLLLLLYVNIYKIAPSAANILPYNSALWSIGIYFFALAFGTRRMFRYLSELIYTGNVELYLVRPLNVLVLVGVRLLGESFLQTVITGGAIIATLLLVVGLPTGMSFTLMLYASILLALGLVVELLLGSIVGLLAIWLENATPVYWVVDKLILIFGGSYVPLAFFPKILQDFSKYSPFGATRFASLAFYPGANSQFLGYLLAQIIWIILLYLLLRFVYSKGQKHLALNGS